MFQMLHEITGYKNVLKKGKLETLAVTNNWGKRNLEGKRQRLSGERALQKLIVSDLN